MMQDGWRVRFEKAKMIEAFVNFYEIEKLVGTHIMI